MASLKPLSAGDIGFSHPMVMVKWQTQRWYNSAHVTIPVGVGNESLPIRKQGLEHLCPLPQAPPWCCPRVWAAACLTRTHYAKTEPRHSVFALWKHIPCLAPSLRGEFSSPFGEDSKDLQGRSQICLAWPLTLPKHSERGGSNHLRRGHNNQHRKGWAQTGQ